MFSIALLLFIISGGYSPSSTVDIEFDVGQWMVPSTTLSSCQGTIGECFEGDDQEEFLVDSESNRRILESKRHISYDALKKDHVPCPIHGASYYNCRLGAAANPYHRGCSQITLCRRG
uniref:Rapid ALkalinization Factor n=1 Tax=Chenopodium quinoa TaxID=63459 RepID=A0A803MN85_CHEQI